MDPAEYVRLIHCEGELAAKMQRLFSSMLGQTWEKMGNQYWPAGSIDWENYED